MELARGFLKREEEPMNFLKTKVFSILISLVLGIMLGAGVTIFLQNYNPPDSKTLGASVVFSRIQSQNELVAASQDYCIVDKVTDTTRVLDLFDVPFMENSFWYRYQGTIKVGVNLADADFNESEGAITVTLDQPYIISNTPDMEASGVLEENNNILNPIDAGATDEFKRECIEKSESQAMEGDLPQVARENAEANLRGMFQAALGEDCQITFHWR